MSLRILCNSDMSLLARAQRVVLVGLRFVNPVFLNCATILLPNLLLHFFRVLASFTNFSVTFLLVPLSDEKGPANSVLFRAHFWCNKS